MKESDIHYKIIIIVLFLVIFGESILLLSDYDPKTFLNSHSSILIVGNPSPDLLELLEREDIIIEGINVTKTVSDEEVKPGDFIGADIILFTGQEYCPNAVNAFVNAYFNETGSRLQKPPAQLVLGNACSRTYESNFVGWGALVEQKVLAIREVQDDEYIQYFAISKASLEEKNGYMIITQDHPIFNGVKNTETKSVTYQGYPSNVLAVLSEVKPSAVELRAGKFSWNPAIVEQSFEAGTQLYFGPRIEKDEGTFGGFLNYNLFFNTVEYLRTKG